MSSEAKGIGRGENGQAMVEYVILVVVIGLSTLFMMTKLPQAVSHYVEPFFYTFSRPLP
jgi:Flp pilus assembly pilin Flp